MTGTSVNFDRAATVYDSTRTLPDASETALIDAIADELAGRGSCLEVGVGTGRLAVPLRRRGIDMYGVDISVGMLTELLRKGGAGQLPLVTIADATDLPFEDGRFDAVLANHVLHLVSDWQRALRELHRVVRRGGVVIIGAGGLELPIVRALRERIRAEAGKVQDGPLTSPEPLEELMRSLGAAQRLLAPIPRGERTTLRAELDWLEDNGSALTWDLADATRVAAVQAAREWAAREYGDLDSVYIDDAPLTVRVYDVS